MDLADKNACTGCGACAKACPKKAIKFFDDDEGFPTPQINSEKCVDCGICNAVCPAINAPALHPIQEAYAAQSLDHEMLMDSTSGGLFTTFSRTILDRGGVVYGCVWDDHYNAVVTKAESEAELKPMRGSKYVWSWAGDSFPEIKKWLDEGRYVLFSGLPCQVAGLKSYLHKEYDNLITMDVLCSGTPSPMVFHSWLDTFSKDATPSALNLKFRDKNPYGWGVHITYNGQKKKTSKKGDYIFNPYFYAYYSHMIIRRSCYKCPYCTESRVSDITIGDYWGGSSYHSSLDKTKGISALMINTEKGRDLFNSVQTTLQFLPTERENFRKGNVLKFDVKQRNESVPTRRDVFFKKLKTNGFYAAARASLYDRIWLMRVIKLAMPGSWVVFLKKLLGRE